MFCPKCGTPVSQADENIEVQNGGIKAGISCRPVNKKGKVLTESSYHTKVW